MGIPHQDALRDLEHIQTRLDSSQIDKEQAKFESNMVILNLIEALGFESIVQAYYEATNEF